MGKSEGPFEEDELVEMIRSRQVTHGNVSPAGTERWSPIDSHPPFGAALASATGSAAAAIAGGALAGGSATPLDGSPARAGSGTNPGRAAPMAGAARAQSTAGDSKKRGAGCKLIALLSLLLLLAAGAAAGWYFFMRGTSTTLAGSAPNNTQIYVEVPDLTAASAAFGAMGIFRAKKFKMSRQVDDLVEGFEQAFDIKKKHAKALNEESASLALVLRGIHDKGGGESAVLWSFSETRGIEKLLDSDRFEKIDKVGNGGRRYAIDARKADEENTAKDDEDADEKSFWPAYLAQMSVPEEAEEGSDDEPEILVWYADEKLLVYGDEDLVEDIGKCAAGEEDCLAQVEAFQQSSFEPNSSIVAWVSPSALDEAKDDNVKDVARGYFSEVPASALSVRFEDAGITTVLTGEMQGSKLPDETLAPSVGLDLMNKLPEETFGYLALHTKSAMDGKEFQRELVTQIKELDPETAEGIDDALDGLKQFDVKFDEIWSSMGDQMVLAVLAADDFKIDPELDATSYTEDLAVALLVHLSDKDEAESVIKELREQLLQGDDMKEIYDVDKKSNGFEARPVANDELPLTLPTIRARFSDEHLLVAAGNDGLVKRVTEAFKDGKKSLADDAAHQRALGALQTGAHAILWIDTGRIAEKALVFAKTEREEELDALNDTLAIKTSQVRVKGNARINSALALGFDVEGDRWRYRLEALNLSAGVLAGYAAMAVAPVKASKTAQCNTLVEAINAEANALKNAVTDTSSAGMRALAARVEKSAKNVSATEIDDVTLIEQRKRYVAMMNDLASASREAADGIDDGDVAKMKRAQETISTVGTREAAIVSAINTYCADSGAKLQ